MMPYTVKLHPNVAKYLSKLPLDISDRIKKKLRDVGENPFHFLEHYEGDKVYKVRIGDYRVLVDIDVNRKLLFVRLLDHRSRVYER